MEKRLLLKGMRSEARQRRGMGGGGERERKKQTDRQTDRQKRRLVLKYKEKRRLVREF